MFDRLMTTSPAPLDEPGEEERRSLYPGRSDAPSQAPASGMVYTTQPEFDPDGEYILDQEPGSPKTNEAVLFPER